MTDLTFTYPKTIADDKGDPFIFRLLAATDAERVLAFARALPESDLMFMRRDITHPEAVADWLHDIDLGRAVSILIETEDGELVGYGTLYYNQLFYNRHLGELRLLISSRYRERGLGSAVARDLTYMAQELGLEKVITYMAVDDNGARAVFDDLGFVPEAVLGDWVKTRDDRHHDLLIMSALLDGTTR